MQTVHVLEKTGDDGVLQLRIPLGKAEAEFEVLVVIQPKNSLLNEYPAERSSWPPGYFERTFGAITDETFARPPQGELTSPVELE